MTKLPFGAITLTFAVACWTQAPARAGDILFEPYRCRTAIEGVAFEGPPAELAKTKSGVRFSLTRGPNGLAVDETTGTPRWPSPVLGRHVVRVQATTGRDSDEVEWVLRVVPKVADDLVVVSTEHVDFVTSRRHLEGNAFLKRTRFLDATWECYYRVAGQEPINDLQVVRWDPDLRGALAGNPMRTGGKPQNVAPEKDWERWGYSHELAHNFNFLIRTPGTWSDVKESEGFGKTWLDLYFHHLCYVNIVVRHRHILRDPAFYGLSPVELKRYEADADFGQFGRRSVAEKQTERLRADIRAGKTMQEAAHGPNVGGINGLFHLLADRHGGEVFEDAYRAMRPDGLPAEVFQDADTSERKFTLFVSILSAAAKKDLRPFFAEAGFQVEKDYYEKVHPRVVAGFKDLLPKEEWVNGWIKSPVTGRYYRVMQWKTDWEQADRTARQWGGRLVEAVNERDLRWLTRRYGHLAPIWLGLRDVDGKQTWAWTSGARADYLKWRPSVDTRATSRYAAMSKEVSSTWSRLGGKEEFVVIVEREQPPVSP